MYFNHTCGEEDARLSSSVRTRSPPWLLLLAAVSVVVGSVTTRRTGNCSITTEGLTARLAGFWLGGVCTGAATRWTWWSVEDGTTQVCPGAGCDNWRCTNNDVGVGGVELCWLGSNGWECCLTRNVGWGTVRRLGVEGFGWKVGELLGGGSEDCLSIRTGGKVSRPLPEVKCGDPGSLSGDVWAASLSFLMRCCRMRRRFAGLLGGTSAEMIWSQILHLQSPSTTRATNVNRTGNVSKAKHFWHVHTFTTSLISLKKTEWHRTCLYELPVQNFTSSVMAIRWQINTDFNWPSCYCLMMLMIWKYILMFTRTCH